MLYPVTPCTHVRPLVAFTVTVRNLRPLAIHVVSLLLPGIHVHNETPRAGMLIARRGGRCMIGKCAEMP